MSFFGQMCNAREKLIFRIEKGSEDEDLKQVDREKLFENQIDDIRRFSVW